MSKVVSRSTSSPKKSRRTGSLALGRPDVDDAPAHRELGAVLDQALAPVADGAERAMKSSRSSVAAAAHHERARAAPRGPASGRCDARRGDDHPWARRRATRRQRSSARVGHDRDVGADPLERVGVPAGPQRHLVACAEQRRQRVAQRVGLGRRRGDRDDAGCLERVGAPPRGASRSALGASDPAALRRAHRRGDAARGPGAAPSASVTGAVHPSLRLVEVVVQQRLDGVGGRGDHVSPARACARPSGAAARSRRPAPCVGGLPMPMRSRDELLGAQDLTRWSAARCDRRGRRPP